MTPLQHVLVRQVPLGNARQAPLRGHGAVALALQVVAVAAAVAVAAGACRLPEAVGWRHLAAAGVLGGIGFTMSIFITNLAFANQPEIINAAKIAILGASSLAGTLGFLLLLRR